MTSVDDSEQLIGVLLDSCCQQVLETMFFYPAAPLSSAREGCGRERIEARLIFNGNPSGAFQVDTERAVARILAANFLGVDENEVSEDQMHQVIAELANMICGSALSSLGQVEYFKLDQPRTALVEAFEPAEGLRRVFELERGSLGVVLRVEFGGDGEGRG
jgi:CheY-specific phosphatase CheX